MFNEVETVKHFIQKYGETITLKELLNKIMQEENNIPVDEVIWEYDYTYNRYNYEISGESYCDTFDFVKLVNEFADCNLISKEQTEEYKIKLKDSQHKEDILKFVAWLTNQHADYYPTALDNYSDYNLTPSRKVTQEELENYILSCYIDEERLDDDEPAIRMEEKLCVL